MRARSVLGFLAALALISPSTAGAPTVDEVLQRHAQAHGGAARWRALSSLEMTGTQITFGEPHPFKLLRRSPNLYRFEQTVLRREVVEVFDGTRAWWINGLMGNTWPLPAPTPQSQEIARDADFLPPLLGQQVGGRIELQGLEPFDGTPAYKLKVPMKDGTEETWYLDPKTYLEVARISRTTDFGEDMECRTYFSDFRSVGGLVFPHRIEAEYGTRNEVLEIEKISANPAIDESLFKLPAPEGMAVLLPLAGDWNVSIETRPSPRAPWEKKPAVSTIARRLDGGLLEELLTYTDGGLPVEVYRAWSFDQFQKLYRITQGDNYTFHLNVLEGTLADGRLTAGNEKTGTTWKTPDATLNMRIIAHDFQADGFQVDWESSSDGGKTWSTDAKHIYTRK
ncbi:MAG TPA: hypothetical protein VFG76_10200 [Candidatus Polarisedimenticolia bacterium]|nr:hypothetical protein [Candidatus Polarisedimenticolia bacterium]